MVVLASKPLVANSPGLKVPWSANPCSWMLRSTQNAGQFSKGLLEKNALSDAEVTTAPAGRADRSNSAPERMFVKPLFKMLPRFPLKSCHEPFGGSMARAVAKDEYDRSTVCATVVA